MRTHKFNARRTSCGLHEHPSKKEAIRCSALQALEKGRLIRDLSFQPRYDLIVNGILICKYVADFKYREMDGLVKGLEVVEDSKGVRTPAYKLKRKLMLALHGIDVRES